MTRSLIVPIIGYRTTVSTEEAERREAESRAWDRLRASRLVLHQRDDGRWVLVAHEPVAIADQDPELWGDQA